MDDQRCCPFCDAPLGDDYSVFATREDDPAAEWDEVAGEWLVSLCARCANDYDG